MLRSYLPSIFELISLIFFDRIGKSYLSLSEVLVLDLGAGVLDFDRYPFGRVLDDLGRILEERDGWLIHLSFLFGESHLTSRAILMLVQNHAFAAISF